MCVCVCMHSSTLMRACMHTSVCVPYSHTPILSYYHTYIYIRTPILSYSYTLSLSLYIYIYSHTSCLQVWRSCRCSHVDVTSPAQLRDLPLRGRCERKGGREGGREGGKERV